jgi:hypothetical protein
MDRLAATYERTPLKVVAASSRIYTTGIRASIGSVTNGGKLRGVGKFNGGNRTGARVGVTSRILTSSTAEASGIVQGTGPLQLIERDTSAHAIPRTVGSRRGRTASGRLSHKRVATGTISSGRRPLLIGGIGGNWVTGPVRHPGTTGKHPFERGVNAVEFAARIAAVTELSTSIAAVLRGNA